MGNRILALALLDYSSQQYVLVRVLRLLRVSFQLKIVRGERICHISQLAILIRVDITTTLLSPFTTRLPVFRPRQHPLPEKLLPVCATTINLLPGTRVPGINNTWYSGSSGVRKATSQPTRYYSYY